MASLHQKHCVPCEGKTEPLTISEAKKLLNNLNKWSLEEGSQSIWKLYAFENFYQTMAFANAVAFTAHSEDHHPTLIITYKSCRVTYTTHAVRGLSENDFICAAKLDQLVQI